MVCATRAWAPDTTASNIPPQPAGMIQLLIRNLDAGDHATARGCKEPLGKAFAIRHCNLIPVQASLQHVEVYNAANRLLSWAQDDTFDENTYQRVDPAALGTISYRWHLCKARSRWHKSSVLGAEERKHVLYLVPCNHAALDAALPPASPGWWPSSPASPSPPANTARRRRSHAVTHPEQDQSHHPCVTQLGTGRCIIDSQPLAYILDWLRCACKLWQHQVVQQGQGYYHAKYKLQLLVVADQLTLQPMPGSVLNLRAGSGTATRSAAAAGAATGSGGNHDSTARISRSLEEPMASAAADIARNSDGRSTTTAGNNSSSNSSIIWQCMLGNVLVGVVGAAVSYGKSIAQSRDGEVPSFAILSLNYPRVLYLGIIVIPLLVSQPVKRWWRLRKQRALTFVQGSKAPTNHYLQTEQMLEQQQYVTQQQSDSLASCVVCLDKMRSVVLLPCKHLVLCEGCLQQVLDRGQVMGTSISRWGRRNRQARACCPVCRTCIDGHVSGVVLS